MAFFKTAPNLPDGARARIEFYLQQIADCVGLEVFAKPVIGLQELIGMARSDDADQSIRGVVKFAGRHLGHDVSELRVAFAPKEVEKCGGGG